MTLYRRRPVLVEAWQWLPYMEQEFSPQTQERPKWIDEALKLWPEVGGIIMYDHRPVSISIKTPTALLQAMPGDWIIKDAKGELHPYGPDIFEATYERWDGDV